MTHLVLVELAVFKLLLSLALERDNDEADENVDHKESDDDDVNNVEDWNPRTVVLERASVYVGGINGVYQDSKTEKKLFCWYTYGDFRVLQ